ncbi:XrtN system VIT domain-containing protein [Chitinophaga sp. YR573]|uniref:XrtN system VIT domain-containing protein n=1 Tax=Chitinophaga sp. YR573 TaxID=1881040 RepID=UPI0015A72CC4|nr:XrtN system VIT domain-containing protein [Chitinophaga sp. YR573]
MRIIKAQLKDTVYKYGLIMLALSLVIFCIPECIKVDKDKLPGWFFGNFILTISYFCALMGGGRLKRNKGRGARGIFMVLLLISAYALNRVMNVFESSTNWFSVLLIVSCINCLAFPYIGMLPPWGRHLQSFLLAISLCCFVYLSCYLLPMYAFGVLLFFVLGISLHAFVALLFVIYIIALARKNRRFLISFWWGIGTAMLILIVYCAVWLYAVSTMNTLTYKASKTGLPAWVTVAQQAPHHFIAQRILKSELVYTTPSEWGDDIWWRTPSISFDQQKEHDPLVVTAVFLCGKSNLDEEERIKVLKAMYDSRHQAEERLWSGDDLYTSHVNTAAQIWPRLHMAYTEKTVTVANEGTNTWRSQEEALYTFHLPEGAVVSSLSLWINNKEEKGILTTKAKADSAYKRIVGYESRDPSVVHWQEGNRVTIRVFPVDQGKSRQFKIGITAPLTKEGNQLVYKNIYFDGPATRYTREDIAINFETAPVDLYTPGLFETDKQKLERHGGYTPDWQMAFKDEGITPNIFGANGKIYSINSYKKELTTTNIRDVYLDINNAWTEQEFENACTLFKKEQKWVYNDGQLITLTDKNKSTLFSMLHDNHFSLFPLYMIKDVSTALLITKGTDASPNITDLEGEFVNKMKGFLSQHQKIMLYNLGGELSPYMRSLKEFRAFRYEQGDAAQLKELADHHQFPADIENEQRVVVEPAGITISRAEGTCVPTAPDHLQRLFAYNHIMQQTGSQILYDLPDGDSLVEEAKAAYIVTPFSSLVVLERKEDYDRFNIKDSEDSLKNASLQSKGSVPEPHEWALIIVTLLVLVYVKFKK